MHVEEFERLALPQIESDVTPADLYVIDEIGKMELMSPRFRTCLIDLLARPTHLFATIAKRGKGFLEQIKGRNDVNLLEVNYLNRDLLADEIVVKILTEIGVPQLS